MNRNGGVVVAMVAGRIFLARITSVGITILVTTLFVSTVFEPAVLAFSTVDRDIPQVGGWTDGGWVVDQAGENRYPVMLEAQDGGIDFFYTVTGNTHIDHRLKGVVNHRRSNQDGSAYWGIETIDSVLYDPSRPSALGLFDAFADDDGNYTLLMGWIGDINGLSTGPAYFMKTNSRGELIVPITRLPTEPEDYLWEFDAAMGPDGTLHYVQVDHYSLNNYVRYVHLDRAGNAIAGPITLVTDFGLSNPHIAFIDDKIFISYMKDSRYLHLISYDPATQVTDLYNIPMGRAVTSMDLLVDKTDSDTLVVPYFWVSDNVNFGMIRLDPMKDSWRSTVQVGYVIDNPAQINMFVRHWEVGIDSKGIVHVIWSVTFQRPGCGDPLYYSAFDRENEPRAIRIGLTAPITSAHDMIGASETPFAIIDEYGSIMVVYDSPHKDIWRIGYIYSTIAVDLSVSFLGDAAKGFVDIAIGQTLDLSLEVKNSGSVNARSVEVTVQQNGVYIERWDLNDIGAAETRHLSIELNPPNNENTIVAFVSLVNEKEAGLGDNIARVKVFAHAKPICDIRTSARAQSRGDPISFYISGNHVENRFRYHIEFGDGSFSDGLWSDGPPLHSYKGAGIYQVGVMIWNVVNLVSDWCYANVSIYGNNHMAIIDEPNSGQIFAPGDQVTFVGEYTSDTYSNSITYHWSSNIDGEFAIGRIVTVGLSTGNHNITLTVMDGDSKIDTCMVTVLLDMIPQAGLMADRTVGHMFEPVRYMARDVFDDDKDLSYFFDFGDGTNSGWISSSTAEHFYTHHGNFKATMLIEDVHGQKNGPYSTNIEIANIPPSGTLAIDHLFLKSKEEVKVSINDLIDPDGWIHEVKIDFGDGTWEKQGEDFTVAKHTYTRPGRYDITASITDNSMGMLKLTGAVVVENLPPTAYINVSKFFLVAGESIHLDGNRSTDPDGIISDYKWNLGNGQKERTGRSILATYNIPGIYQVTLTVKDEFGSTNSTTLLLHVEKAPEKTGPAIVIPIDLLIALFAVVVMITGVIQTIRIIKRSRPRGYEKEPPPAINSSTYDQFMLSERSIDEAHAMLQEKTVDFYRYLNNDRI